jgi:ATP-dependent helicase Lhr and Lhr-like helicase
LAAELSVVVSAGDGETEWWTFGGNRANATLAQQLSQQTASKVRHDSFTLTFEAVVKLQDVQRAITEIRQQDVAEMRPAIDEAAVDGLKFSECLPAELAIEMLQRRLQDAHATRQVLEQQVRFLVQ